MASTPAHGGAAERATDDRGRTAAQWLCLIIGPVLILAGILGFIADASFDVGDDLERDSFLGLDVNGWHNLVHIASGVFLVAMAPRRSTARAGAIAFGLVYAVVTLIGFIDGDDVLGFMPVDGADNVLHLLLTIAALWAGLISPGDEPARRRRGEGEQVEQVRTVGEAERERARAERGTRQGPET
jgi:hypothetical protein